MFHCIIRAQYKLAAVAYVHNKNIIAKAKQQYLKGMQAVVLQKKGEQTVILEYQPGMFQRS